MKVKDIISKLQKFPEELEVEVHEEISPSPFMEYEVRSLSLHAEKDETPFVKLFVQHKSPTGETNVQSKEEI